MLGPSVSLVDALQHPGPHGGVLCPRHRDAPLALHLQVQLPAHRFGAHAADQVADDDLAGRHVLAAVADGAGVGHVVRGRVQLQLVRAKPGQAMLRAEEMPMAHESFAVPTGAGPSGAAPSVSG